MQSLLRFVVPLATLWPSVTRAQLEKPDNSTMPTSTFFTRPQSNAPAINVTFLSADEIAPGFVFMGPYEHPGAGPYIYDKFGNLVWDGFGLVGPTNAHDFRPCQYKGSTHLCLTAVNQQLGYGVGVSMIIDTNYRTVATVQTGNSMMPGDMHEFKLVENGENALLTSFMTVPYDLSPFNISTGQGWLLEGAFQEVNIATGEVMFEWFSTNHVDPLGSDITPGSTDISGDGLTPQTAFDYFHINSLDKSEVTGNYLISARHMSTLYYINATDQEIIWRLSWRGQSDFECTNFNFSFEHDARLLSEDDTTTVLSIFDNASNGFNNSSPTSSGKIIVIDHPSAKATLFSAIAPPPGVTISISQGNTQILDNGNIFNGWGAATWYSEHSSNGTLLTAANFALATTQNYRVFSGVWESTPAFTKPSVYSYALNEDSPTIIYASWNGATTVAKWRFYAAPAIGQEFTPMNEFPRLGFESIFTSPKFHKWVFVEALAADGTSLRNSSFQPTFVPSQALASSCNTTACAAISTS